jgi:hypothetical protein
MVDFSKTKMKYLIICELFFLLILGLMFYFELDYDKHALAYLSVIQIVLVLGVYLIYRLFKYLITINKKFE